jgi:hypothetical protein
MSMDWCRSSRRLLVTQRHPAPNVPVYSAGAQKKTGTTMAFASEMPWATSGN